MAAYRAHRLDKLGHFKSTMQFHAPSDEDAIERMKPFLDQDDLEIWEDNRRVVRLKAP